MKTVFVQVNTAKTDWDNVPVSVQQFDADGDATKFARRVADVMKCNVRLSYPSQTWDEKNEELTTQQYAGRLSGSYFHPQN